MQGLIPGRLITMIALVPLTPTGISGWPATQASCKVGDRVRYQPDLNPVIPDLDFQKEVAPETDLSTKKSGLMRRQLPHKSR